MNKFMMAPVFMLATCGTAEAADLNEWETNTAVNYYMMQKAMDACPGYAMAPATTILFKELVLPAMERADTSMEKVLGMTGEAWANWQMIVDAAKGQECQWLALMVGGVMDGQGGELFSTMLDFTVTN
jgi:hypothetical protein